MTTSCNPSHSWYRRQYWLYPQPSGLPSRHSSHSSRRVRCRPRFNSRCTSRHSGTGRLANGTAVGGGNSRVSTVVSSMSAGKGQLSPAASARARYSYTVVLPMPVLRAISVMLRPPALSRSTSPILRMGSLLLGTRNLLAEAIQFRKGTACLSRVDARGAARPVLQRVASPQDVFAFSRIGCSDSIGLSVRIRPDSLFAFRRNTHLYSEPASDPLGRGRRPTALPLSLLVCSLKGSRTFLYAAAPKR